MASAYPSGLDSQSTSHQDNVGEFIHASTVNDLADAVNKIEAELGTLPKGQFASVSAKLKALFYNSVTTTQRDAITAGNRPAGMMVFNTTTNRYEYNSGSDASPVWSPVGPAGPWGTTDIQDSAITSAKIANGTIVDVDISSSAAIALSKLNTSGTASSSTYLRGDAAWTALTLSTTSAFLGADVPMSSANVFFDGPQVSLSSGTWLIVANATFTRGANGLGVTAKLWDGSTTYASAAGDKSSGASGQGTTIPVHAIVALGGTTTVKISTAADASGATLKAAAPTNPAGNTATSIFATKIG